MSLNDYDKRQLELMLEHIQTYRKGTADLSGLISGLESLCHLITEVPDDWLERFWAAWGDLEEIYSIAVVREQPIEALRTRPVIFRSVSVLENLVKKALDVAGCGSHS